jgi:hypothetical protein
LKRASWVPVKEAIINQLQKRVDRIIGGVNIRLQEFNFDAAGYLKCLQDYIPLRQLIKFYAFYGVTPHQRNHFQWA